ncbi:hypothetical protein KI387_012971, partial [Taxus chinensis]
ARDELQMRDREPLILLELHGQVTFEEWSHIDDVSLIGIHRYGRVVREQSLMVTLIERWDSVTNTFHLLIGEMTITLEDIYRILRLPINGDQVYSVTFEVTAGCIDE